MVMLVFFLLLFIFKICCLLYQEKPHANSLIWEIPLSKSADIFQFPFLVCLHDIKNLRFVFLNKDWLNLFTIMTL